MGSKPKTVRIHVTLPRKLVEEIDALVGPRKRSKFIAEAIAEELRRRRELNTAKQAAGSLADVDVRGWETSESTVEWVQAQRRLGSDHWVEAEPQDQNR